MLKKKKTTASGKLVLVKSVGRTRSHRMKFCVQRDLGALSPAGRRRGKSRGPFALCRQVCIDADIACRLTGHIIKQSGSRFSQLPLCLCLLYSDRDQYPCRVTCHFLEYFSSIFFMV